MHPELYVCLCTSHSSDSDQSQHAACIVAKVVCTRATLSAKSPRQSLPISPRQAHSPQTTLANSPSDMSRKFQRPSSQSAATAANISDHNTAAQSSWPLHGTLQRSLAVPLAKSLAHCHTVCHGHNLGHWLQAHTSAACMAAYTYHDKTTLHVCTRPKPHCTRIGSTTTDRGPFNCCK